MESTHWNKSNPGMALIGLLISLLMAPTLATAQEKTVPEAKRFQDWMLRCEQPPSGGAEQCFVFQNLVLREGKGRVLLFAVTYPPKREEPVAILTLPLGISLPPGVSMQIAEDEPLRLAVEHCIPGGCRVVLPVAKKLLDQFKAEAQLQVTFHDARRRPVKLSVSLKGFTAALKELKKP